MGHWVQDHLLPLMLVLSVIDIARWLPWMRRVGDGQGGGTDDEEDEDNDGDDKDAQPLQPHEAQEGHNLKRFLHSFRFSSRKHFTTRTTSFPAGCNHALSNQILTSTIYI